MRLVTSLIDLMNRTGYHCASWVYQTVQRADPGHPLYPSAVGVAARVAWVLGDFTYARTLARMAAGMQSSRRPCYLANADDVIADAALYEGDAATALAHYEAELPSARSAGDPIRLVLIFDRITMCHYALGNPEAGLPAAEEAIRVADAAGNPTARSLARCTVGRALARVDPEQALEILDQANEIGASVGNNWCTGMATLEAVAIRSTHGDPVAAARILIPVLDHWEHAGPVLVPQMWDTLRHTTRLLFRLGAKSDVASLQRFLADAGRESPLDASESAALDGADVVSVDDAGVVEFARTALRRFC